MPPSNVKAYLKRSKNDANDAAAICEAVMRPSAVVIRKRISRAKVLEVFAALPSCLVGIEACPNDRPRPMLQERQKVLATAPSTRDP